VFTAHSTVCHSRSELKFRVFCHQVQNLSALKFVKKTEEKWWRCINWSEEHLEMKKTCTTRVPEWFIHWKWWALMPFTICRILQVNDLVWIKINYSWNGWKEKTFLSGHTRTFNWRFQNEMRLSHTFSPNSKQRSRNKAVSMYFWFP
jgi:hypothetical protein